jgi:hypothetical protein
VFALKKASAALELGRKGKERNKIADKRNKQLQIFDLSMMMKSFNL